MSSRVRCLDVNEGVMSTVRYILLLMIFFIPSLQADEIVINKEGKPIKLHNDNTWSYVDTSKNTGKLVFSITNAEDYIRIKKIKDDFGNFIKTTGDVGCKYQLTAVNNTKYDVSIKKVHVVSNNEKVGSVFVSNMNDNSCNTILKSGESVLCNSGGSKAWVYTYLEKFRLSETPTKEKIDELQKQYGCDSQSGHLFISRGWDSDKPKNIVFNDDSGLITQKTIKQYISGDVNGVYPLLETIECPHCVN